MRNGKTAYAAMRSAISCLAVAMMIWWLGCAAAQAEEHVSLKRDGREVHVIGKVLVEAQDGGMLLVARDGVLWIVQPEELVRRQSDTEPFQPLTPEQMAKALLEEMPTGFRIHQTANYVICYNTTEAYAQWCGGLYERLNRAFYNYWKNRGVDLHRRSFRWWPWSSTTSPPTWSTRDAISARQPRI